MKELKQNRKCPMCQSTNNYTRQDGMTICRKCGHNFTINEIKEAVGGKNEKSK